MAASTLTGQVLVDKPVVLTGAAPEDRRVENLADPASEDEALNARTLQNAGYVYAEATGADDWSVMLAPAPAAAAMGMKLMVRVPAGNAGPVTITMTGLGTWPVVKNGSYPLEAGDLDAGEVAALLFDGTAFHLLTARRLDRRPCPSGFAQVNELYCIEINERDTLDFRDAAIACGSSGAHLCAWGAWYAACVQAGTLGLQDMIGNWEWTNSAANSDTSVRTVGQSSCTHAGITGGYGYARNFRCCFRR